MSILALSSTLFFNDTATTEIYTLSLHDALPISRTLLTPRHQTATARRTQKRSDRSEEHTSELQSLRHLVCRLLLEKINSSHHPSTNRTPHRRTLYSTTPPATS